MDNDVSENPEWVTRGKTIKQLIQELQSFENQELEVKISIDGGDTFKCISLVGKHHEGDISFCGLENYE
ncbi:hypothetical protein [Agarivorans albus]|uniref:Uncharacterized protein n=1 Tax=Agarivorans albus MKT 106 TaxID=1331007 RepID=R9PUJ1_AGAAL|nr:hypothetical protein [Agarivorans albus]GAD04261.1 hypothetical protein AALB_4341 [Agarivorans albus MKT 106]